MPPSHLLTRSKAQTSTNDERYYPREIDTNPSQIHNWEFRKLLSTKQTIMNQPQHKRVSFNTEVSLEYMEPVPLEDQPNAWFSRDQYASNRKRERMLRRCVNCMDEDNWNSIGIYSPEDTKQKHLAIENAVNAVLREQERQVILFLKLHNCTIEGGTTPLNDEEIAQTLAQYSKPASSQAHFRAIYLEEHLSEIEESSTASTAFPPTGKVSSRVQSPCRWEGSPTSSQRSKMACRQINDLPPPIAVRRLSATLTA